LKRHPLLRPALCAASVVALAYACVFAEDSPEEKRLEALIGKLADVAAGDAGYSATMSGSKFAPLDRKAKMHAGLLGQAPPVDSETLAELVIAGAAAVPKLIAHLNDARETKLKITHELPMGGMFFDDEYDYNGRTLEKIPEGVNRNIGFGNEKTPTEHTVTVGDLCFVAIGQIVNRHFNAVRYQPTACIMINSPTYSKSLREAITKEWAGLTPESHRRRLSEDALKPDYDGRREDALRRLSFYYPKDAEAVAVQCLRLETYCVFAVERFAREKLYKAPTEHWKELSETFVRDHGEAFRFGLLEQLRDDAASFDKDYGGVPGQALAALFPGTDPKKARYSNYMKQTEQARLIDALAWFDSQAVDDAVLGIFRSLGSGKFVDHGDDYLALACMRRLRGKNVDAELEAYCKARIPKSEYEKKELSEMLSSLKNKFRP
jgi:hypothetical protein